MENQNRPLGVQISRALKARGVDVIFGIPGVHNVELYRGIEEAGITHVLARHEQGAGFMADGFARATGRPGVAYVITGPGLCNIMTPMGQAYSDSVPVLVVSSCLDEIAARRGQLHQMKDQATAAATVCDWSQVALGPEAAYQLLDRAFAEFATKRPRSKHIQVPIKVLGAEADTAPAPQPVALKPQPSMQDIGTVAGLLAAAKRPLFVFGGGLARGLTASDTAARLLDQSGAACFVTYAGRGVVPADHPLSFGATLPRSKSTALIASSDLVIAIGTELAEVDLWRDQLGHSANLVRIDIDPEVLADQHRADIQVLSDGAGFVTALSKALAQSKAPAATGWDRAKIAATKAHLRALTDAERPGIVPILDAIQAVMPADTMFFSDMTQFAYVGKEVYPMSSPNLWHHPTGFGTLGYALPAAIGGKIGRGDKPVVAMMGDYGFHYTMQELGVAVELGLCVPILLWDNGKLKEIEDSMLSSQIAPNAVVARNPDFCALARAFGAKACKPGDIGQLQAAIKAALSADGPTLIHITPDVL